MVGRDLLIGSLFGILLALIAEVVNALPAWFNLAGQTPINGDKLSMYAAAPFTGFLILCLLGGLLGGLNIVFALFVIRTWVKNYGAAMLAMALLLTLTQLGNENVIAETIAAVLTAVLLLVLPVRFGLFATVVALTCNNILVNFPIGTDPARWYFLRGFIPVLLVAGIAVYGFWTSLGGRPVLGALTAEE
jgi:hypothetical protein